MPTVPNYTGAPSVEPDAGAKAGYLKNNATPEAFGVGVDQAVQGFGKAVGQAGSTMGDWADKLQDQYNEAAQTDMENRLTTETAQKTAEFNQLKGKAAVDATPAYQQFLQDKKSEILGTAPNSAVARMADRHLTRVITGLSVDATRHQVAQTFQYNQDETSARISLSQDAAGQNIDDLDKFHDQLAKIEGDTKRKFATTDPSGQSSEVQLAVRQELSKAWDNRFKSLTMQGKADQAMQEYNGVRDKILDPDARIHDAIYTGQTSQYVQKLSQSLATGDTQTTRDRENYAMTVLQDRVGKIGAAGLVGGMSARESGMNPTSLNPGDGSDGSDSIGIAQWNAERATALKKFAKEQGTDWHDFKTQVAFVDKELQDKPELVAKLKAAKTPEEAATIANASYEVSADKPGTPEHQQRERAAARLAGSDLTSSNPMSPTRITDLVQTARANAEQGFPNDPKIADQAEQAVRTRFNLVKQDWKNAGDEATYNMRDKIYGPTDADPNARPPTREQLMQDPTFKANYDAVGRLPNGAQLQDRINRDIQRNITATPSSPQRDENFQTLKGVADSDPARFKDMDLSKEDLTRKQASDLHQEQKKITTISQAKPDLGGATRLLKTEGFFTQIGMKASTASAPNLDYDKFVGQLNHMIEYEQSQGRKPTPEFIRKSAQMLATDMSRTPTKNEEGVWQARSGGNMFYQMPIPADVRTNIFTKYQQRFGRPPNEGEVRDLYNQLRFNQAKRNPEL